MPVTGSRTRLRRRSGTYVPPSGGGGGGGGGGGDTGGGAWEGTTTGNLFASPSGNDGNSGTVGSPFKTVDKLISTLSPGQTGVLRGGTYPENTSVGSSGTRGNSGTSGSRITICNYASETPVINGEWYLNCSYLTFKGLVFSYSGNRWSGQSLIVEYSTIDQAANNGESGFHLGGSGSLEQANDMIIRRCRVKNITTSGDVSSPPHGVYADRGDRLVVEQCKFHDIGGAGSDVGIRGVQLYNASGGLSNGTVRDCIIDRCNGGIIFTGSGHKVERTIITRCTTRQAVEIYSGSASATNCHTHNNSAGNYESGVTVTTPTSGDPLYTNEAGRIYTPLGAGSPAVGKGTDW